MLLDTKNIGALLRVFATTPELVAGQAEQVMELARRIGSVKIRDKFMAKRIEILIPLDPGYTDVDCGKTAKAVREIISKEPWAEGRVFVSEVKNGDVFCSILNYGMYRLARAGCDYGLVASKEAYSYFNQETAEAMIEAAEAGALAIGVAISELEQLIMQGRVANTMALWHISSLQQVCGFDLKAAKQQKDDPSCEELSGWDNDKQLHKYGANGCEEIIPLIRMYRMFKRPIIATFLPKGTGIKQYEVPDPIKDPVGHKRHWAKMYTKAARQAFMANYVNADMSVFNGAVMEQYRHPDYQN